MRNASAQVRQNFFFFRSSLPSWLIHLRLGKPWNQPLIWLRWFLSHHQPWLCRSYPLLQVFTAEDRFALFLLAQLLLSRKITGFHSQGQPSGTATLSEARWFCLEGFMFSRKFCSQGPSHKGSEEHWWSSAMSAVRMVGLAERRLVNQYCSTRYLLNLDSSPLTTTAPTICQNSFSSLLSAAWHAESGDFETSIREGLPVMSFHTFQTGIQPLHVW